MQFQAPEFLEPKCTWRQMHLAGAGGASGAEGAIARAQRARSAREARQNVRYINIQTQKSFEFHTVHIHA